MSNSGWRILFAANDHRLTLWLPDSNASPVVPICFIVKISRTQFEIQSAGGGSIQPHYQASSLVLLFHFVTD